RTVNSPYHPCRDKEDDMKRFAVLVAASAILAGSTAAWAVNSPTSPTLKNIERTVQRTDFGARQVLMDDGVTYRVPDRDAMGELRPGDTFIIDAMNRDDGMPVITKLERLDVHWLGVPPGFGEPIG